MAKKYGVVLIGCGHMGAVHLEHIYYKDNIIIEGVVDINEDKARLFSKKYGAKSYSTNYEDYLDNKNADIIIIATYPSTHLEILKKCIKSGKHIN